MREDRITILPPPPPPLLAFRAAAHALYHRLAEAFARAVKRMLAPPEPRSIPRCPAIPPPPYEGPPTVIAVRRPA
jgi:hypothetical protein